jgi:hypothetical protein
MGSMISDELLQANANLVVLENSSIVRRIACCAAEVMLKNQQALLFQKFRGSLSMLPVGFIKNHDFVFAGWHCYLLLGKHFDFVSDNIDTTGKNCM